VRRGIAAVAAVAILASACSAEPPASVEIRLVARPGDAEHPFAFEPASVTIRTGGTVRWVNATDAYHTVTSTARPEAPAPNGLFDLLLASKGDRAERRFDTAGTYAYFCQPHSGFMRGKVIAVRR
jgi:plastocyanin